jgi:hypothetical protein
MGLLTEAEVVDMKLQFSKDMTSNFFFLWRFKVVQDPSERK